MSASVANLVQPPHRRSSGMCEHTRRRNQCVECGGSQICEHQRQRATCRECGGSHICKHNKNRSVCKECAGSQICEHSQIRGYCKRCGTHRDLLANGFTREQIQAMACVTVCERCFVTVGEVGTQADHAHHQPCEERHARSRRDNPCPECFRGNICNKCNMHFKFLDAHPDRAGKDDLEYMARRPLRPLSIAA